MEEAQLGWHGDRLWFKVSDIVGMNSGPDMLDWLLARGLEKEHQSRAYRILDRLYQVIHTEPTVAYYEELNQDIEHVLSIFIRRNSGGTTLSYSDLLLSIATSQWKTLDARKEVHRLVDELNQIGPGLELTKDFVLKAGLMLTDIASVGFQVRNFTQTNMKILEDNWQKIRDALIETVQIVTGFGFNAKNIRAASAPASHRLLRLSNRRTDELRYPQQLREGSEDDSRLADAIHPEGVRDLGKRSGHFADGPPRRNPGRRRPGVPGG